MEVARFDGCVVCLAGNRSWTYKDYLSHEDLQRALKQGRVFRCEFRVNANDRRMGFAGLEGLPADIQIQVCALVTHTCPLLGG